MTSTTGGDQGLSFGFLNYKVIEEGVLSGEAAKGKLQDHIHVFGGEERFWLGPEGGQYGLFFPPGKKFEFADWKTPAPLDTEAFKVVASSPTEAVFQHDFELVNYSGTRFQISVERVVRLLSREQLAKSWKVKPPAKAEFVAYETVNRLTNRGKSAWKADKGLISVWLLGMFKPTPDTIIVVPIRKGSEKKLGPTVNDAYFGKVPADRLVVTDDTLFFRGDGAMRGKIGVSPSRSLDVAGSYSESSRLLTVVMCQPAASSKKRYVNSMWEHQKNPYAGDAINSYNDGSPGPGQAPLGPFYELETSSPGAELAAGASMEHRQMTIHLQGEQAQLDPVASKWLDNSIAEIKQAFEKK
jgi:hypothetical protein